MYFVVISHHIEEATFARLWVKIFIDNIKYNPIIIDNICI